MPPRGFEPLRLSAYGPKPYVSANSTTEANTFPKPNFRNFQLKNKSPKIIKYINNALYPIYKKDYLKQKNISTL